MTDILKRIQEFKQKKAELEKEASKIQTDFENYISDQSLPLAERWSVFSRAPEELQDHSDYFITPTTKGLKYVLDNWFDAPEIYGRGKRIDTTNIFERIFNDKELNYDPKYVSEEEVALCKEAMEDILSQNCGSFCFDW